MSQVLSAIEHWANTTPNHTALYGRKKRISYDELLRLVQLATSFLVKRNTRVLGIAMHNSPAWAIFDLAAVAAKVTCVPIPPYFSAQQIRHVVHDANIDTLLTDQFDRFGEDFPQLKSMDTWSLMVGHPQPLAVLSRPVSAQPALESISKITYTSGTTGHPKGVLLAHTAIETVVASLREATRYQQDDRQLVLLPLATLLENIGAVYLPLLCGATSYLFGADDVGVYGATQLDAQKIHAALAQHRITRCIVIPQILQALIESIEAGSPILKDLRFIAVGGAPVSALLLKRADLCQLPVYEGYGLSECASVVAVNSPRANRRGSVGKLLPHISIRLDGDGEILISGATYQGYLGFPQQHAGVVHSGDLGFIDEDGFLYITSRKKNIFITSFGRNVAPEWVERELVMAASIEQAMVYGEAKPFNVAIIVAAKNASPSEIQTAIDNVNRELPDYARIKEWQLAEAPFSVSNDELTSTGRLRRAEIHTHYQEAIEAFYQPHPFTPGVQNEVLRTIS